MAGIDPDRAFYPLNIAVLTVSDTRTLETDTSGGLLIDRLTGRRPHARRPGDRQGRRRADP